MKLARRAFLKVMGAAPVAAPIAAKQSVLEFEKSMSMDNWSKVGRGYFGTDSVSTETPDADMSYFKRHLTRLLENRQEVQQRRLKEPSQLVNEMQIDGLRSVSSVNRARMITESRYRLEQEKELCYLDNEIALIRKKLGLLGVLFE